jgi:ribosome-associated translation inhibitor RaiA
VRIEFHAHQTLISDSLRLRATRAIARLAERTPHPVDAAVRVERDGPEVHVEVELHAKRRRPLVGTARARHAGPAFTAAIAGLEAQVTKARTRIATRRTTSARA